MPHRPLREIIARQRLLTALSTTSVADACILMKRARVGALPVLEDSRFVGIFTERDAVYRVLAEGLDPAATALERVMTRHPHALTPDRPFGHALHLMYEGGFRHVPVIEHGRLVGMVSQRDALSGDLAQFESDVEEREHIAEILG